VLQLDRYRGRSCFPPLVQSAELFVRRELGEARLAGLTLDSVERSGDDRLRASYITAEGAVAQATVTRHRSAAVQLTCSAATPAQPWRYVLDDLTITRP
jgi:hypothetical protein